MAISDHFSKIITIIFVVCSEKRLLGQNPHTLFCSFDNHLSNAVYFVATAFLRGFFRAKKWPWVFPNTHDTHSSGVFFIVSVLFFHTHCARTNSIFDLHHWHNAGNHSMPLDSDGLAVTRQRPTHQTKVEWLLVTQPAKCRLWSYDLPKKAQFKETLKHDCCWCNNQKLSTDDMRRQTWAYTNPVHTDTLTLMLTHWNTQMYNQCYKNTVQHAGRLFKKGFCTTICSQMTFRIISILKYISAMKVKMKVLSHVYKLGSGSENISLLVFFFFVVVSSLQARWKSTTCNAVARSYQRKCQSTQQVMRFDIWHQSIIRPAPAADGVCSFARGSAPRGGLLRDREG